MCTRLKFQSQRNTLSKLRLTRDTFQSEFYDNVIVALTEIPVLEPVGPVLLLGLYDEGRLDSR